MKWTMRIETHKREKLVDIEVQREREEREEEEEKDPREWARFFRFLFLCYKRSKGEGKIET